MGTELDDAAITPWARPSDPNWHLHLPSAGIILHVVCIGIIEPCPDMFECTQYIERMPELRSIIACARREGNYEPVREAGEWGLSDRSTRNFCHCSLSTIIRERPLFVLDYSGSTTVRERPLLLNDDTISARMAGRSRATGKEEEDEGSQAYLVSSRTGSLWPSHGPSWPSDGSSEK